MKYVAVTPKKFEEFKRECSKYIEILGLKHWRVDYAQEFLENNFAECRFDSNSSVAIIVLTSKLSPEDARLFDVLRTARHEMIHLVIGPLRQLAESRYVNQSEILKEEERIIRIIEKLI